MQERENAVATPPAAAVMFRKPYMHAEGKTKENLMCKRLYKVSQGPL